MKKMNYPKATVVRPEEESILVTISSEDLIDVSVDPKSILERRIDGEFLDRGYFLNKTYNWQIVLDSTGALVLVPTKK